MDPYFSSPFNRIQLFLSDLTYVLGHQSVIPPTSTPYFGGPQLSFNCFNVQQPLHCGPFQNQLLKNQPTKRSRAWKRNHQEHNARDNQPTPLARQPRPRSTPRTCQYPRKHNMRPQTINQSVHQQDVTPPAKAVNNPRFTPSPVPEDHELDSVSSESSQDQTEDNNQSDLEIDVGPISPQPDWAPTNQQPASTSSVTSSQDAHDEGEVDKHSDFDEDTGQAPYPLQPMNQEVILPANEFEDQSDAVNVAPTSSLWSQLLQSLQRVQLANSSGVTEPSEGLQTQTIARPMESTYQASMSADENEMEDEFTDPAPRPCCLPHQLLLSRENIPQDDHAESDFSDDQQGQVNTYVTPCSHYDLLHPVRRAVWPNENVDYSDEESNPEILPTHTLNNPPQPYRSAQSVRTTSYLPQDNHSEYSDQHSEGNIYTQNTSNNHQPCHVNNTTEDNNTNYSDDPPLQLDNTPHYDTSNYNNTSDYNTALYNTSDYTTSTYDLDGYNNNSTFKHDDYDGGGNQEFEDDNGYYF